jgi:hypothetical protein
MNDYVTFITLSIAALLVAIIIGMRIRYRRMLKQKDEGIYRQIREEQRLSEELNRALIAKETLKEVLETKLNDTPQASAGLEKEITLLVKARKIDGEFSPRRK